MICGRLAIHEPSPGVIGMCRQDPGHEPPCVYTALDPQVSFVEPESIGGLRARLDAAERNVRELHLLYSLAIQYEHERDSGQARRMTEALALVGREPLPVTSVPSEVMPLLERAVAEWLAWLEDPDKHLGAADRGLIAYVVRRRIVELEAAAQKAGVDG